MYNKKIKLARCAGWDAYTRGGCAIMRYVPAPVIEKLGAFNNWKMSWKNQ